MKYSLISTRASPPRVIMTYPFRWMAQLMERVHGGERRGHGVAETPTDPQEIIDICVHRDTIVEQLRDVQELVNQMVGVMFELVARGDDGHWTTVHDADHRLSDEANATCNRVFGA